MLLNKRIPVFYFLKQIKYDLFIICIYAIVVGILDHYTILKNINVSMSITGLLGTVISLLLAFRTSQSYERWWEARVVWGAIVNDSRTLVRQFSSFLSSDHSQGSFVKDFAERHIVWCFALVSHLRRVSNTDRVELYLKQKNISAENVPNKLLSQHSEDLSTALKSGLLNDYQHIQLDSTTVRLCDSLGKCERIKNTVFPKSYSLLIHFIIYTFVTLLPFALKDEGVIVEILLTIFIPSVFIAIEKTSILMQDPFENTPLDTPMTTLSTTIERNIQEMIGIPLPKRITDDTYFQM